MDIWLLIEEPDVIFLVCEGLRVSHVLQGAEAAVSVLLTPSTVDRGRTVPRDANTTLVGS